MLAQQIFNGLALGALYGLFAVGYTMVFGVLNILNLAHGAVYMSGALLTQQMVIRGVGLPIAFLVGCSFCGLLGWILERSVLRPLRGKRGFLSARLMPLVGSLAFAVIVESFAYLTIGIDIRRIPEKVVAFEIHKVGSVVIDGTQLVVIGVTICFMFILHFIVKRTLVGKSMRAIAESTYYARVVGVNVDRIITYTVIMSSVMAGAAGILIGIQSNMVYAYMGHHVELKGLAIIVIGGLGSITGSVLAGFLLGLVEVLTVGYLASGYQTAIVFGSMLCLLIFKPWGLFGIAPVERA